MDTTLRIQNDYSWVLAEENWIREILWHKLRFRKKDYFHHPLYKQKIWDGFIDFFGKTTGWFLTGLLPEVESALTALKVPYLVNDLRTNTDLFRLESIDENFLNRFLQAGQKPITLYDFQVDLTNQAIKYKRGRDPSPYRKWEGTTTKFRHLHSYWPQSNGRSGNW